MKKNLIFTIAQALSMGALSAGIMLIAACEQPSDAPPDPPPAALTGIAVASQPDIQVYALGQPFDPAGLAVTGTYEDGTERNLEPSEYEIAPPDTSIPGPKQIAVTSGIHKTAFAIMVRSSSSILQSIELTAPPSKTVYELGEDIDFSGMKITGSYSDGAVKSETLYTFTGYDWSRRGTQTITLTINRKTLAFDVTVKIPASAELSVNGYNADGAKIGYYQQTFIKGMPPAGGLPEKLKITVKPSGGSSVLAVLTAEQGDFTAEDLFGYDPNKPGFQTLTLKLDDKTVDFKVYVIDVEPHVFFDYGYWRHPGNPEGGATVEGGTPPQYTVPVNTELVITPTVFSLNTETPSYSWTCTAPFTTSGPGNKYLTVKPGATGTYTARVTVNAGAAAEMTATATILCTPARPAVQPAPVSNPKFAKNIPEMPNSGNQTTQKPLIRNYAPGQFTAGGSGWGWSLGTIGGYCVWKLQKPGNGYIHIEGNPFGSWNEPGIVWVSADDNHDGLPNDTWYELKGSDDEEPWQKQITRSYGVRFVLGSAEFYINQYHQRIQPVFWVDCKGRTGRISGAWPYHWGTAEKDGEWVEMGATLLRDDGMIANDTSVNVPQPSWGYVDCMNKGAAATGRVPYQFYLTDAVRADGAAANLPYIDFVRVQNATFRYGGSLGELSCEISWAEGLGTMTDFPMP